MRRTSWVLAIVVGVAVLGAAVLADRVGSAAPPATDPATVTSQTWFCPHGGGREWRGTLVLANPSTITVPARITALGTDKPGEPESLDLPPGRTVLRPLAADTAASATVVEAFDADVGVGFQVRGGGAQTGLGAEPCLSAAATAWWTSSISTAQDDHASLVVMNPFRAQTVFDITLYSPDGPPLRDPAWTDVRLGPGRSATFDVSDRLPGKQAVAVVLEASAGRTVVGTLTTTEGGGIRSAVASPVRASRWYLPVASGAEEASILIGVTDDAAVRLAGVLRSEVPPRPAGGLLGVRQAAVSAASYEITVAGPSAAEITAEGDRPVIAGLIARGAADDDAASGGTTTVAERWIVTPTAAEEPWSPHIVVVNPGEEDVEVVLRTLPSADDGEAAEVTITVPAGQVGAPPRSFLEADPRAAVVLSADGPVVALGASMSSGLRGIAWYALAIGIPVVDAI